MTKLQADKIFMRNFGMEYAGVLTAQETAKRRELQLIEDMRHSGMSWAGIGAIMGITGFGAKQRYDNLKGKYA